MKVRILAVAGALALALVLVGLTLALAQDPTSAPTALSEAEREAAAAAALEANPRPPLRAAADFTPPAVISGPLLVGVDDSDVSNYLIDPATADNWPLFDGFEIWGAAFDAAGKRLFFNEGPTLSVWPLDGAPGDLGLIVGEESGVTLSFFGLAYHDGTLYGARQLHTTADPKGIYTIDPVTLSATLLISYDIDLDDIDIGGLAVDPADGVLYGTNDAAGLRGLVRIDPDGTLTVVAPYPAGQNDIDGLAIGDGRAYLVPDAPGELYVFDLATLTYTTPITNPWTAANLFAGAAWIEVAEVLTPTISLTKTVGLDPTTCATTTAITVTAGSDVTYCYEVTNTGNVTMTRHTLTDTHLSGLPVDLAYDLAPLASYTITETATLTETSVNTATWTAYNPGPTDVVTATAAATVTVTTPQPAISLTKTVGVDATACAVTTAITVTAGSDVTYCYEVTNTGNVTLTRHTLTDTHLSGLPVDLVYDLAPLASYTITETATLTETTANTATWTAYNPGPTDAVTATAAATVTVAAVAPAPDIAVSPGFLTIEGEVGDILTATLTISNSGDADLTWTAGLAWDFCPTLGGLPWASVVPSAGTTTPGNSSAVVLSADAGVLAPGDYGGVVCVAGNDPDDPLVVVPFTVTVTPPPGLVVLMPIVRGSPED